MDSPLLYTPNNCSAAYQLRWSLALFPRTSVPPPASWLEALQAATEPDGVRVLEAWQSDSGACLLLVSTRPDVRPHELVKSVKGRLQTILRRSVPKVFRRNFELGSVGSPNKDAVEDYIATQLQHHRMADPRVQTMLESFQLQFETDLSVPQLSAHGRYLYNLHFCFVHEERWKIIGKDVLLVSQECILHTVDQQRLRPSRISLLPDHIHSSMGCDYSSSPEEIALVLLNNLAIAHGGIPLFMPSYYVGTFGDYDMRAIWRKLKE